MVGNDPAELRALAQAMRAAGQHLSTTWQTMDGRLGTAPWTGPDAERFRADWHQRLRPSLTSVTTMLDQTCSALLGNADEQDRASAADGAGSTGSPNRAARDYLDQGLRAAGIDPATWNPSTGVDGNRATVEAVYAYYSQLYRDNPEMAWAGMAGIATLLDAGKLDQQAYDAWAKIDQGSRTGDTDLIRQGNESLLRREQSQIIRDQYD